jgi:hypothetical protein
MLVTLDSRLISAYMADGQTRMRGVVPPDGMTVPVHGWKASKAMAADLLLLHDAVLAAGGSPLRLVEVYRPPSVSDEGNAKYLRWVAAGKPRTAAAGFDPRTMKTAYVRPAGTSGHNAGTSADIDQDALLFPRAPRGTDAALAVFWGIAKPLGFTPIIATPSVHQSECWHFDHFGPLTPILALAAEAGRHDGNLIASMAATTLQGYAWPTHAAERYAQASLLATGFWCGPIDGDIGKTTMAAVKAAGGTSRTTKPEQIGELLHDRLALVLDAL